MNIINDALPKHIMADERIEEIKVEVDNYEEKTIKENSNKADVPASDYSIRYPYPDEVLPPVYMSTIAKSSSVVSSYQPSESDRMNYVNADYNREYQNSPPNIDKAPTFVSKVHARSSDVENHAAPPSPSTTPPEDKHVWSKAEVELLLDMYETYKDQLKDPRVRKTKVWEDVARVLRERLESDVNGCQCNQKFRNLKADFQKVLEHNGRPGNFKRVCKYYDRLANLLNYPQTQQNFHSPHSTYNSMEAHETTEISKMQLHRDLYYENGRGSPSNKSHKRKLQESIHLNELQNGHTEPYCSSKQSRLTCACECSHELANLRESVERVNNYVVARSAHEEERIRRLEEMHREKLIALSRFVDIFKDFIHKMS